MVGSINIWSLRDRRATEIDSIVAKTLVHGAIPASVLTHPSISVTHASGQRNRQQYHGAFAVIRDYLKLAAQALRARPHTHEPLPLAYFGGIKARAIVRDFHRQPFALDPQLNLRLSASGVTRDIVDSLLENQKDLTPQVRPDSQRSFLTRSVKAKLNLAGSEDVAGKAPHSLYEIAEMIFFGIDRPDDVAHRINQVARRSGNYCKRLTNWRLRVYVVAGHRSEEHTSQLQSPYERGY